MNCLNRKLPAVALAVLAGLFRVPFPFGGDAGSICGDDLRQEVGSYITVDAQPDVLHPVKIAAGRIQQRAHPEVSQKKR